MSDYTPRLTQPSNDDLRWRNTGYGGYNPCIEVSTAGGNNGYYPYVGSVLGNCTGYCHGRWMELGNTNTPYNISTGHASLWYSHADGYERGSVPKLGAIVCFSGGTYGHVAIVEEISEDGSYILCSESNFGRSIFEFVTRYRSIGWSRIGGTVGSADGFIYHPDIQPTSKNIKHDPDDIIYISKFLTDGVYKL